MTSPATLLPALVLIPGGRFRMGDDRGRADEKPAHTVTLAAFWAAVGPVTNAAYAGFVEGTGREPPPFWAIADFSGANQPVVGISWSDAVAYCAWLSNETGRLIRLPTEAEREWATRGGVDGGTWPWGDLAPGERHELAEIARLERPHVPGETCANACGLRCMADNVHEWCSDWYDPAYYAVSPERDPRGPASGRRRASRGGSWRHQVKFNRCAARSSLDPAFRYNDYGFRVYTSS